MEPPSYQTAANMTTSNGPSAENIGNNTAYTDLLIKYAEQKKDLAAKEKELAKAKDKILKLRFEKGVFVLFYFVVVILWVYKKI